MKTATLSEPVRAANPVVVSPAPRHSLRERLNHRAARFWLGAFFASVARRPRFAQWGKPVFVGLAWCFSPSLRRGAGANARRLLPASAPAARQRRLARSMISNFYDFVCDVGSGLRSTPEQLKARVESVTGHDRYLDARKAGNGAIIMTAHMGSFEVGIAALTEFEPRIHVVFRRDPMDLFEGLRSSLRRRLGVLEAPVDDGWTVWMRLRDALLANEVVVIQGDRVMPGQKGQRVPFLGGHTMLPSGPVKLAQATGAPIIPVFTVRTPQGKINLFIEEPVYVEQWESAVACPHPALVRLAGIIEHYVREYPDQWLVAQPALCEDVKGSPSHSASET